MLYFFFFLAKLFCLLNFLCIYLSVTPILSPSCVNSLPVLVLLIRLGTVSSISLKNSLPEFSDLFNLDLLISEHAA